MEPEVLSRTYPDIIRSAAGVGPDATSRTKSVQSCGDNRERARPAVQGCRMDLAAGSHHERQATSGQLSLSSLRKRGRYRGGEEDVLHRPRGHVGGTHATWAASVGDLAGSDQGPPSHRVNRRRRCRLLLVVVAGESQSSPRRRLHRRRRHPCATPFQGLEV